MRFSRFAILAACLAVFTGGLASRAQEAPKPFATVSISPLDRFMTDTTYLLRACNVPEIGGVFTMMGNQYTQGIDRTKPIGVSVTLNGQVPSATIFLPMTDRTQFFGALAGMGIEPDDLGDGLYEFNANGQNIFAKQAGDWMFVAQSEDALTNLPADPSTGLGALPNNYNLAVRIDAQVLPAEMKSWAIDQMRTGVQRGLAEQSNLTDEEKADAERLSELNMLQLEQLVNELEHVVLGWNVDSKQQRVYIDTQAEFIAGSKFAKQMAQQQAMTSYFTKLGYPGAAVNFRFTSKIVSDEDKELQILNLRNSLKQFEAQAPIPEESRGLVKDVMKGVANVIEKTIQEGSFDGAGSASVADDTLHLIIGGRVADGRALETELKKVAAGVAGKPKAPKFEFDYDKHQGMSLHRITAPIGSEDRNARKILGDSLNVTVATTEKAFIVSVDPAGDAAIKAAIDRVKASPGQTVSPFDGLMEAAQIMRFAQAVAPNSILDNAIQTIQQYAGKDKLQIASSASERGGSYRISIDEGILRAAGAAAKSGGGNGGGF